MTMRTCKIFQLFISLFILSFSARSDSVYISETSSSEVVKNIQFRFSESRTNLQNIEIPQNNIEFSYHSEQGVKEVTVIRKLPLVIKESGSDNELPLYEATVNNENAIITLENNNIQLSYSQFDGNNETLTFTTIEKNKVTETLHVQALNKYQEPDTSNIQSSTSATPNMAPKPLTTLNSAQADTPPEFIVYLFENHSINDRDKTEMIHQYFSWWAKHMEEISSKHQEQTGNPLFSKLTLEWVPNFTEQRISGRGKPYTQNSYWYNDYNGRGAATSTEFTENFFFRGFRSSVDGWHGKYKPKVPNARMLYILVGANPVVVANFDCERYRCSGPNVPTVRSNLWLMADPGQAVALATLKETHYPAKVLGQLMGAREDLAATGRPAKSRSIVRLCLTINSKESGSKNLPRCKYYSEENRKRIIEYFSH